MFSELRRHPKALIGSAIFHLLIILIAALNLHFSDSPKLAKSGDRVETVKAEIFDQKQLDAVQKEKDDLESKRQIEQARKKQELAQKQRAEREQKKVAERERKAAEQAKKVQAEKEQAELKRKKQDEEKRQLDQKREHDEKKKADDKRKSELAKQAEEKRKNEEARQAEIKRKADEAKLAEEKRQAAETKRLADEAKRKQEELERQAELRRQAEEAQRRQEAELKARMVAEENQRRLNSLRNEYIQAIAEKVQRNWIKPAGSGKIPLCEVKVVQGPGGIILDVTFGACSGSTQTYRASIENAVYKAEPLPKPGDPALFDREIKFLFNPTE